jgi:hypothetical protein
MTTFLPRPHPRRRQMETTAPQLSCSPAFTTAFVLFSHSIIFMRMHACPSPRSNLLAPPVCCCIVCVACTTIVCAISLPSCNLPMCYPGPLFSCPELQINHCPFDELLSKKKRDMNDAVIGSETQQACCSFVYIQTYIYIKLSSIRNTYVGEYIYTQTHTKE